LRNLKNYIWTLPFIGALICIISFFTPAAYFENIVWNHTIINWIWGYYYDKLVSRYDQSITIENGFYSEPIQFISSFITSVIIVFCILIIILYSYKNRTNLKNGIIKSITSLFPAVIIIISTITWMIMMEIAELQIYGLSMWDRYTPNFGLIGMYIGATVIIVGFILIKKYSQEIIETR